MAQHVPRHTSSYLPAYTTPLVGRDSEAQQIIELLRNPNQQLITLLGESGTGKTRLALQISQLVADYFPDGITFAALAPVRDPFLVIPFLAETLQIRETGTQPLLQQLIEEVSDKKMLLILDNMEQLLETKYDLTTLLKHCPHLTILITSQVALQTPYETIYTVPPLSFPASSEDVKFETLQEYTAIALFVERMRSVQPRFQLTPSNAVDVIEICQLLQGLPMAIELVAAHSDILPPDILLLLLRTHLFVCHQEYTLRKKIIMPILSWCYSRLEPRQRWLFPLLCVMKGTQIEAAQQIVTPLIPHVYNQNVFPEQMVAEDILILKEKNLLLEEALPHGHVRYVMLDVVQEFGMQLFHRNSQHHEFMEHYSRYYLALAEQGYDGLKTSSQGEWMLRLAYEQHNLRAVWEYLFVHNRTNALRMTIALSRFWFFQGMLSEASRAIGHMLEQLAHADTQHMAQLYHEAGLIAYALQQNQQAEQHYAMAYKLKQDLRDRSGMASALNNLGLLALNTNRLEQARNYLEDCLAIWYELTDTWNAANTLNTLGIVALQLDDEAAAFEFYTESLQAWQTVDYPTGQAMALNNLGEIELQRGHYQTAWELLESAREIWQTSGGERFLGDVYLNLSQTAHYLSDHEHAYQYGREALQRKAAIQDLNGVAQTLESLALVLTARQPWPLISSLVALARALRTEYTLPRRPRDDQWMNSLLQELHQAQSHIPSMQYSSETLAYILEHLPPLLDDIDFQTHDTTI